MPSLPSRDNRSADDVEAVQGTVGCLGAFIERGRIARFDRVEQLVDGLLGVMRHDECAARPPMWDLAFQQRLLQHVDVGGRPLRQVELGHTFTVFALVVEQRHGERTDLLLELVEQRIDIGLDLFGDDDLIALPRVRDASLGERLGQLGALLEAPPGQVVMDLDLVGVVGIEVDIEAGRRAGGGHRLVLVLFSPAADDRHGRDASPRRRERDARGIRP